MIVSAHVSLTNKVMTVTASAPSWLLEGCITKRHESEETIKTKKMREAVCFLAHLHRNRFLNREKDHAIILFQFNHLRQWGVEIIMTSSKTILLMTNKVSRKRNGDKHYMKMENKKSVWQ